MNAVPNNDGHTQTSGRPVVRLQGFQEGGSVLTIASFLAAFVIVAHTTAIAARELRSHFSKYFLAHDQGAAITLATQYKRQKLDTSSV